MLPSIQGAILEEGQHDVAYEHAHVAAVEVVQVGCHGTHPETSQAGAGGETPHIAQDVAKGLIQSLPGLQPHASGFRVQPHSPATKDGSLSYNCTRCRAQAATFISKMNGRVCIEQTPWAWVLC